MKKIIKKGDVNFVAEFTCRFCGCVFQVSEKEISGQSQIITEKDRKDFKKISGYIYVELTTGMEFIYDSNDKKFIQIGQCDAENVNPFAYAYCSCPECKNFCAGSKKITSTTKETIDYNSLENKPMWKGVPLENKEININTASDQITIKNLDTDEIIHTYKLSSEIAY